MTATPITFTSFHFILNYLLCEFKHSSQKSQFRISLGGITFSWTLNEDISSEMKYAVIFFFCHLGKKS